MAWESINNFLRILLLIVVCIFAIYFFWMNEKSKKSKETFVTNVEQDYRDSIVSVFRTTLNRDPQQFEIQLYRSYMKTPFDTDYIQKQLMESNEYVLIVRSGIKDPVPDQDRTKLESSKVVKAPLTKLNDADLQLYRSIVNVYELNLFRMPNTKEVDYYMGRMKRDTSFTLKKLEQVLQMSEEYLILEKNQSNLVNADMKGSITDAQVTLIVNSLYKEVYGVEPPAKLMDFLKGKYTEYKFDNVKFKKMLVMLRDLESGAAVGANAKTSGNAAGAGAVSANAKTSGNTSGSSSNINANSTGASANTNANTNANSANTSANASGANSKSSANAKSNTNSGTTSKKSERTPFGSSWNPAIKTESKSCTKSPYDINKFYDSLYENNRNVNVDACINSSGSGSGSGGQQPFADRVIKRNDEELQYSCNRNSYSTQVDEKLMSGFVNAYDKNVLPSQRNTRFGSFLADADDTKVGSIMPKFIYKEYN